LLLSLAQSGIINLVVFHDELTIGCRRKLNYLIIQLFNMLLNKYFYAGLITYD